MGKPKDPGKIFLLLLLCLLFNFSSGCGLPFIRPEKYEAQKIEKKKNRLLKRHRKLTGELRILDGKLDDVSGQILIYRAKQNPSRVMSVEARELNNEYIKMAAAAENERKALQKKYDALENALKEIEQTLKTLDQPMQKK